MRIFTSSVKHERFNPLQHGQHLTCGIVDLSFFSFYVFFFSLFATYPFSVRQSMVGKGGHKARVHHPEGISHALHQISEPLSSSLSIIVIIIIILCYHCPMHHSHLQCLHGILVSEIVSSKDDPDPVAPSHAKGRPYIVL